MRGGLSGLRTRGFIHRIRLLVPGGPARGSSASRRCRIVVVAILGDVFITAGLFIGDGASLALQSNSHSRTTASERRQDGKRRRGSQVRVRRSCLALEHGRGGACNWYPAE